MYHQVSRAVWLTVDPFRSERDHVQPPVSCAYGIRQGNVVRIAHHQGSVALRIVILPIYFIDIPLLHPSVLALPIVVLHRFQLFHRWPAPVFLPEAVSFPRRHGIRCHLADQLRQAECIEITPIQVGVQRCHTLLFRVQPQGGVCRLGALPEKFRQVAREILEQVLPEKLTFRQSAVGLRSDIVPQRQQGFALD